MPLKTYHVVPREDKRWGVIPGKGKRSIKNFDKKGEAVKYAKGVSKNQKAELKIHNNDGEIHQSFSYGNDRRDILDKTTRKKKYGKSKKK